MGGKGDGEGKGGGERGKRGKEEKRKEIEGRRKEKKKKRKKEKRRRGKVSVYGVMVWDRIVRMDRMKEKRERGKPWFCLSPLPLSYLNYVVCQFCLNSYEQGSGLSLVAAVGA